MTWERVATVALLCACFAGAVYGFRHQYASSQQKRIDETVFHDCDVRLIVDENGAGHKVTIIACDCLNGKLRYAAANPGDWREGFNKRMEAGE